MQQLTIDPILASRAQQAEQRLARRHDPLNAIKARAEYASRGEPGRGQDDLWWLIGEVDRLRAHLEATR